MGATDLIDLEFLPAQDGESIVIGKGGTVYYLKNDFTPLAQTVSVGVASVDEQGLLNVEADPDYATNRFLYLYFTVPAGDANRVDRYMVSVDTAAGTFSLNDRQTIIDFPKTESPSFDDHHNGGGIDFDASGNLVIGVGDGGGEATGDMTLALGQDRTLHLGKVHRIVPNRTAGAGGFTIPTGGNGCADCLPEIYALGLRNPFSLVDSPVGLFVGDVGSTLFEEVDRVTGGGLNFGWPLAEGGSTNAAFTNPILAYGHRDRKFADDDPADNTSTVVNEEAGEFGPQSVIVLNYYTGTQYGGRLTGRLLYTDFFQGWVRGFKLTDGRVDDDKHFGHQAGLTSLQAGPDGFLYGTALFGSDRILRVDLAP